MASESFGDRFSRLIDENPVKFIGAVQALISAVAGLLAVFGLLIPAAVVAGLGTIVNIVVNWWTQDNKTVPEYRAHLYKR